MGYDLNVYIRNIDLATFMNNYVSYTTSPIFLLTIIVWFGMGLKSV